MTEATQAKPTISNIASIAVAVILIGMATIIVSQQNDLKDAVKALAIVSAKCSK